MFEYNEYDTCEVIETGEEDKKYWQYQEELEREMWEGMG
jgi:hypothetical protein